MMLSAVFNILSETTVYGNAIARRPVFDTVGIGLGFGANVLFVLLLVGPFGLWGAAIALAASNFVTYAFRTLTAQKFYASIESVPRTLWALGLGVLTAAAGTLLAARFPLKLAACAACACAVCLLYRRQLRRCLQLGFGILRSISKALFLRAK
jgi:O-antigen/teichoic acid export membrane protein